MDNDCDESTPQDEVPGSIAHPSLGGTCLDCSPQSIIDLGPVAYWTLDDEGSLMVDSSGHGWDGQVVGLADRLPGITDYSANAPMWPGLADNYVIIEDFDFPHRRGQRGVLLPQ